MPRVYHVSHAQRTDLEPQAGWYVGPLTDDNFPHGPFTSRERAEDWRDEHAAEAGGLTAMPQSPTTPAMLSERQIARMTPNKCLADDLPTVTDGGAS